jgi:hypothetical protein
MLRSLAAPIQSMICPSSLVQRAQPPPGHHLRPAHTTGNEIRLASSDTKWLP